MSLNIQLQEFTIEWVDKGKTKYGKGKAVYTYNGQNKEKYIMSFANPKVFAILKDTPPGTLLTVEVTKNAQGYDEWSSVVALSGNLAAPAAQASGNVGVRVAGSNYETKEERAARQVLIVRQSSLSAAIAMLSPGAKGPLDPAQVLELAQRNTDWVFQNDFGEGQSGSPEA